MKSKRKWLFTSIIFILEISCSDNKAERITFNQQLGTYILDMQKTSLGVYNKDSNIYQELLITFKVDSTFMMNMKVPFMYDSVGKWKVGDGSPYSYNQLYYKSFNYDKAGTGEQFFPPASSDSIFLLNSTTPQKGAAFIKEIYFKKLSR